MQKPATLIDDAANAGRGFLMGAADIVPGVSGGTVALILGIYHRLVTALSRVDRTLLGLLATMQWRKAASHLDLRFLLSLGVGIGVGIVSLAHTMHELLTNHREITYAAFFGLILASGVLVGRMCRPRSEFETAKCLVIGLVGALVALWLVRQDVLEEQQGLLYTFLCGCVGICAMILPGVSGSYILLLLNKYEEITGIIKGLSKLQTTPQEFVTLCVFASGCIVGLLVFSKALKWLLVAHGPATMAVLCGFMNGSLWKIWPFQRIPGERELDLREQSLAMKPYIPELFDKQTIACLAICLMCFAGVLVADYVARRSSKTL